MAMAESLLDKLLRLETLQHHRRLDHLRRQMNELDKHERLIASLEQLACSGTTGAGVSTGMQVSNTVHFHALLLTMEHSCQLAREQRATAIKSLAETTMVNMARLQRLRQRLHNKRQVSDI